MAIVDSRFLSAYVINEGKIPFFEFDVALNSGDSFTKADLDAALASSVSSYSYISIQTQQPVEPATIFVGKFSLSNGYNLSAGAGRKVTVLTEVILYRTQLDFFNFISESAGLNLHITVFG